MRVISGIYKGKKLESSNNLHIRPTTNRVKEYIFNILDDFPVNKTVVDIFSGSGGLGIEAISRGADKVCFVDKSGESLNILQKNISACNIPNHKFQIIKKDAIKFVKQYNMSFDLYLIDPPFDYPSLQQFLDILIKNRKFSNKSMVVLEHEISNPIDEASNFYEIIKKKKFGRSIVNFMIKKGHYAN
jgi:16S rRNA (guanine966-N2)-methyltransferase